MSGLAAAEPCNCSLCRALVDLAASAAQNMRVVDSATPPVAPNRPATRRRPATSERSTKTKAVPRRRVFPATQLARYPLTQPAWLCQRCGAVSDDHGPWELDHMFEIHLGGPDHPHNLVRLCDRCHRAKPYPLHLTTLVEWRLAILTWVLARPNVRWWDPEDLELQALLRAERAT